MSYGLIGNDNEEILSDASDVEGRDQDTNIISEESDTETAEEKRLRLAKKYLDEIERQGNLILFRIVEPQMHEIKSLFSI